jgi:hypothetical protein
MNRSIGCVGIDKLFAFSIRMGPPLPLVLDLLKIPLLKN